MFRKMGHRLEGRRRRLWREGLWRLVLQMCGPFAVARLGTTAFEPHLPPFVMLSMRRHTALSAQFPTSFFLSCSSSSPIFYSLPAVPFLFHPLGSRKRRWRLRAPSVSVSFSVDTPSISATTAAITFSSSEAPPPQTAFATVATVAICRKP